jgi:hypothetical protein
MAYHDGQPFSENMLRPCPMLENPEKLPDMVRAAGAHSTDPQSPETARHLCAKCEGYAACWAPAAQKLWDGSSGQARYLARRDRLEAEKAAAAAAARAGDRPV